MNNHPDQPAQWHPQQSPYGQPPFNQPPQGEQPITFYSQPTQMYPGQFHHPLYSQPPKKSRHLFAWYRAQTPVAKLGLGCGTLFLLCLLCICSVTAFASTLPQPKVAPTQSISVTSTPTKQPVSLATTSTPQLTVPSSPTDTPTATSIPTPTATPTPTQAPTPTPTPRPQPTQPPPTPTPVPHLTITFTCAQAVDYSSGSVCVHTLSGAALTIKVKYCSGYYATSSSLQGTVSADGAGNYTWNWTPDTKCKGTATAYVTANWNGQSASNADSFTVQ